MIDRDTFMANLPAAGKDRFWKLGPSGTSDWEYGGFFPDGESVLYLKEHRVVPDKWLWITLGVKIETVTLASEQVKTSDGKDFLKRVNAAAHTILGRIEVEESYGEYLD